jgi:hypothetical protein
MGSKPKKEKLKTCIFLQMWHNYQHVLPSGEMVSRFPLEEFFNVQIVGGQF